MRIGNEFHNLVGSIAGPNLAASERCFWQALRNEPAAALGCIPAEYPVVESEGQVGHLQWVEFRDWESLEGPAEFISHQPGQSALEGRQVGDSRGRELLNQCRKFGEGLAGRSASSEPSDRIGCQIGVSPQLRIGQGTVEQQAMGESPELLPGPLERTIWGQFANYGDKVVDLQGPRLTE